MEPFFRFFFCMLCISQCLNYWKSHTFLSFQNRNLIDPTIIEWEIEVESDLVNEQHDVFTMKKQCSLFLPVKTFTLKRGWSYFDQADQQAAKKAAKENKSKHKTAKHEKYTQQGILLKEEGFLYQSLYKITANGEGKSLVQQSLAYDLRWVDSA